MTQLAPRRVVTGLDDAGKSAFIIDGPVPQFDVPFGTQLVWQTKSQPADNSSNADVAEPYQIEFLHTPGSTFAVCEFKPHSPAMMHATDTIDYLVILSGRVTLVTENGEAALGPGDLIVDRGVMHGWRNDHDEPCIAVAINIPAHPVARGRTI